MSNRLSTDGLSPEGAAELASKINEFWRQRGYDAQARVDRESLKRIGDEARTVAVYGVRTNMVNGVPSRKLG